LVLISIVLEPNFKDVSQAIKLISLVWIAVGSFFNNRRIIFFHASVIVIAYVFLLGFYRGITFFELLESGMRYLIPIIAVSYGFRIKAHNETVLIILLSFILLNDIYQLANWVINPLFNEQTNYSIYRATGFIGYFDLFGFINMMGLVIISQKNIFKLSHTTFLVLSLIFSIFLIWSLSLKMIIIFILYVLVFNRKLLLLVIPLVPLILVYKDRLIPAIQLRFNRYVLKPQSARSESYRVVKDYFSDFLLIGKGPGTFGGPISTRNQSALYEKYNFNWFGEQALSTTDTYYPHLIVELGVLFAMLYVVISLLLPIVLSKNSKTTFLIIMVISVNSIFSFALNALSYCLFSFMLIFILSDAKYNLESKNIVKVILTRFKFLN
jgi:hypothetical protein